MEVCQDRGQIEKLDIFHEILTFLKSLHATSRGFLRYTSCVTERPRQHRNDRGRALRTKRYTLRNLTISRNIEFFPQKRSEFRGKFAWMNLEREPVHAVSVYHWERTHTRNGGEGSVTSFPTRAADSVSDSVRHSCSSFRCVRRSVSTCPPRGNLVDGLPRAPSGL